MENFDWTRFTVRIPVNAAKQALYDAWTIPSEIEKWFLSNASFQDLNEEPIDKHATVQKGFSYAWQWYGYDITEYGTVTEANNDNFLAFTFAGECVVEVRLIENENDGIIVTLTQHSIPVDDKSKRDYRLGCHSGWSFFLVNLKSVYEGGLDLRNKNDDLKGMINS